MTIGQTAILGIIQGLTEFFPVSSSAHLLLLRPILSLGEANLWLDVILHGGTWLAVIIYLIPHYSRIINYPPILLKIIVATIPAGLSGLLLEEIIENQFREQWIYSVLLLIILGIVFIYAREKGDKSLESISWLEALFIGLAQSLALFPGVSRSGITLLVALSLGMKKKEAVLFSFFLSLTTIGGAFALGLLEIGDSAYSWLEVGTGFVTSFVSGLFACVYLLKIVEKGGLKPFGYYRILFGIFVLGWMLF
ncbi:MAG: undecaprenyl-diphosphatase [Candidatus Atribacteria bacterium]|nr:undecaprenyl-diphosphatase [Candidatus Atribacteria bacterium]